MGFAEHFGLYVIQNTTIVFILGLNNSILNIINAFLLTLVYFVVRLLVFPLAYVLHAHQAWDNIFVHYKKQPLHSKQNRDFVCLSGQLPMEERWFPISGI